MNGIAKKARRHGQLRIRGGSYQAESRAPHSVRLTAHARPSPEPLTNPPFHSPQFTGCRPPQRRVLYRRITARSSTRAAAATATATNNSRVLPKVSFSLLPDPPPLHLFFAPDLAAAGRQFLRGQPRAEPRVHDGNSKIDGGPHSSPPSSSVQPCSVLRLAAGREAGCGGASKAGAVRHRLRKTGKEREETAARYSGRPWRRVERTPVGPTGSKGGAASQRRRGMQIDDPRRFFLSRARVTRGGLKRSRASFSRVHSN